MIFDYWGKNWGKVWGTKDMCGVMAYTVARIAIQFDKYFSDLYNILNKGAGR